MAASGRDGKRDAPSGRAAVRALRVPEAAMPVVEFDLSDNTNAFGSPPSALAEVQRTERARLARYPSTYSASLRESIAAYVGVDAASVVLGCGSDDLIDCAFRAFGEPGDRVAHIDPTFVMARVFAATNALVPIGIPLDADFDADVDALLEAEPTIVYLCTPNNPTGTPLRPETIQRLLQRFSGLVLVDEAYAEYAGVSMAGDAPASGRAVVLRTFSKAWGMAGLRVGYAVAAPGLIEQLEKVRGPFKVTAVAERAVAEALARDVAWMRSSVERTLTLREDFMAALRAMGRPSLPSQANFVLIPVPDAGAASRQLLERGVSVRPFADLPLVGDALRVTIGPWTALQRVLDVLSTVE